MDFSKIQHTDLLLAVIQKENLFDKLVKQVKKDLELIGIINYFKEKPNPTDFFNSFKELIVHLIDNQFEIFLHLLYRMDIDENKIRWIIAESQVDIYDKITFIILKREWQKVWYKENFN